MERNPSPPNLTEDEERVLSTDCIGDTVFSKRWVLKLLVYLMVWKRKLRESLAEADDAADTLFTVKELDGDLEEELCELWDMTTNQDVCEFLADQDGVDLLFETTLLSNYPRLTEICIGILGNMVCLPAIATNITNTEKYRTILLSEINNDDPQTLIELTRLIKTCVSVDENRHLWFQSMKELKTMNQLAFILESSLNVDLIQNVADLVDFVFDKSDDLLENAPFEMLLHCLSEALQQTRSTRPQCVDTLVHIIQLITTTKAGLKAFGGSDSTQALLCKVLAKTDLNLVTAMSRLPMLASAFSALGVLCPNYEYKFAKLLSAALVSKMILTLEVLQRMYSSSRERKDSASESNENDDEGEDQEEEENKSLLNHYAAATFHLFQCIIHALQKELTPEVSKDVVQAFRSVRSQVHIVLKFWESVDEFKDEVSSLRDKIKGCNVVSDMFQVGQKD